MNVRDLTRKLSLAAIDGHHLLLGVGRPLRPGGHDRGERRRHGAAPDHHHADPLELCPHRSDGGGAGHRASRRRAATTTGSRLRSGRSGASKRVGGSWITSWVDLAIYPVLFVDYSAYFFPVVGREPARCDGVVAMAVIWTFAYVEHPRQRSSSGTPRSSSCVDRARAVRSGHDHRAVQDDTITPFEPFAFAGRDCFPAFGAGLFVIMWNYMGWDGLSTVAGGDRGPAPATTRAPWPS